MPPRTTLLGEELTGQVSAVFYTDTDSGFGVVELDLDGEELTARCSGPLAGLVEGQAVRLVGDWREHARYGRTFEATLYEQLAPSTVKGLAAFLHSERFADVPGAVVERVLTTFGAAAGRVIEEEPTRLTTEAAVDEVHVERLVEAWAEGQVLASLVRLLEPAGVPADVVRAIHVHFGPTAPRVAEQDPYRLTEVRRCTFGHADGVARAMGIEPTDPRRLRAGARAALAGAQQRVGHQLLPLHEAVTTTGRLLGVDAILAREGVDLAVQGGLLATERLRLEDLPTVLAAWPGPAPGGGVDHPADLPETVVAVYTARGREREEELARCLVALRDTPFARARPHAEGLAPSEELTAGQRAAVVAAFQHPVSVLTGGPGTGKTRTIAEVVALAEEADLDIALCAPTGRAAKRLEELVGRPATTIHRLLQARPLGGGGFAFRHGEDEPLPFDLVVADEVSMCDTSLAAALVRAVEPGAHLVLVGDPDQLPSVGPGDVLRDVLRSGAVPVTRLTEIHRQAAQSRIVSLAREINAGQVGVLKGADGDVFLAEDERDRLVARIVEAVTHRIPDYFDVAPTDIQVVAPVYRGPVGVDALNLALREALNPATGLGGELAGLRVGDRVLQTRNDADLDVANGDIGTVVDVALRKKELRVAYPRGEVTYDSKQARDLTAAWAITVHKSQGGEWPVVVLVADRSHRGMLWRNLVYTAVTRAQRALLIAGQADTVRRAAQHDRPSTRHTGLAARLRAFDHAASDHADRATADATGAASPLEPDDA